MKKFLSIFALFMAIILSVSVFVACTPTNDANTTTTNNNGEENKVTVTWYYGSKVLKEEKVEKGSTLTSWEPTEEGKTFTGWYSEASATTPFDFTSVINEDTDIFAAFKGFAGNCRCGFVRFYPPSRPYSACCPLSLLHFARCNNRTRGSEGL